MTPRRAVVAEVAADRRREQPGPDDVVALGAHVHRIGALPQVGIFAPAARDLRRQRRCGPRVHHVVVADEAARLPALRFVVTRWGVAARVDRQHVVAGHERLVPDRLAMVVERVPQRYRHAEVALPADQPVAGEPLDPVGVAALHVGRMPRHLRAAGNQRVAQIPIAPAVADVPLAARDDLERAVALLEELHGMGDRAGLADEIARFPQQFHGGVPSASDGPSRELPVRLTPGGRVDARRRLRCNATAPVHDRPHGQVQLAPPGHVGGVAERADHGDTGALVGLGQLVGDDRHLHAEQRRRDRGAEQRLVALVVGMGHQRHACRQELRPSRLDVDGAADGAVAGASRAVSTERDAVVGTRPIPVFQFCLRDRGAEGDVPQRRRLDLVRLAAFEVAQEGPLSDPLAPLVDRGVGHRPVHAEPELAPERFERMLVFRGQHMAQIDEVAP